ncbi:hypothetical protein [Nocardia lasii]|uniref:Regulatory protein RecX n=1 Tax=Nocardia lasii TaxID=1616107 RepID=A0ABW1JN34_9NOCA
MAHADPSTPLVDYQQALLDAGHRFHSRDDIADVFRLIAQKSKSARPVQRSDRVTRGAEQPTGVRGRDHVPTAHSTEIDRIVVAVLREDPEAATKDYQRALRAAGFGEVGQREITAVFQRIRQRRAEQSKPGAARADGSKRRLRKGFAPSARARTVEAADRCPSCDVVPDRLSGSCRCG